MRRVLLATICLLLIGCSQTERAQLLDDAEKVHQLAARLGARGSVKIHLTTSGGVNFGPGMQIVNGSYVNAELEINPAQAPRDLIMPE